MSRCKSTKTFVIFAALLGLCHTAHTQRDFFESYRFTRADTLRGMLRPERTCYDVAFYDLNIRVDVERKRLEGYVDIHYAALEDFEVLQIDLYRNMQVNAIRQDGQALSFAREEDAIFVTFPPQKKGKRGQFRVYYEGAPTVAPMAPWQGGFVWAKDPKGHPWVGVACEGDGASLWWPNKDHLSDEPDSMRISVSVPNPLMCVSNGNLRSSTPEGESFTRYEWFVSYPINNYNVTVNIGRYAHFSDVYYAADSSSLALDYYVLPHNLEKAKKHFRQVHKVLACFERYFGKYPFWNDGFALVETPYLGMEHQGAIAYGNRYMRGYLGGMIPEDMDWDYIIVHETGHEYFGNSVGCNDLSDMWIHESFTTYMESLFVECEYGYTDAVRYLQGQRPLIANQEPVLGPHGVNWEKWKSSDHYYKGAWILHTLRHSIGNDSLWFGLLHDLHQTYAYRQIDTDTIVQFVNAYTGTDYTAFFEQYLWYPNIPVLLYKAEQVGKNVRVSYKWKADAEGFRMPAIIEGKGRRWRIFPEAGKTKTTLLEKCKLEDLKVVQELFLIQVQKM